MDQLTKLKETYLAELNVQYKNLIAFLQTLPISENFKNYGFINLDQGLMWMEKGISFLQVQQTPPEVKKDEPQVIDESIPKEPITIY